MSQVRNIHIYIYIYKQPVAYKKILNQIFFISNRFYSNNTKHMRFANVFWNYLWEIYRTYIYIYISLEVIYDGCKAFEERRIEHSILKRSFQNQDLISITDVFFNINLFETSVGGIVCLQPDLLVISDLMTANNRNLILQRSFFCYLPVIRSNTVTKCLGKQRVWEAVKQCVIYGYVKDNSLACHIRSWTCKG